MIRLSHATVDADTLTVQTDAGDEAITPTQLALLLYLVEHQDRAVTREELQQEVLGYREGISSRALDNVVYRLRKKVEADARKPDHIISVRGVGYRFAGPAHEALGVDPPASPSVALEGRAELIDDLVAALSKQNLWIHGLIGVGASAVAEAAVARLGVPIHRLDLGGVSSLDDVQERVAADLGVEPAQLERAFHAMPEGVWWFDDAHDVAGLGAWLVKTMGAGAACRWVVTSHHRFAAPGVQSVEVSPLGAEAARRLFVTRARAARLGFDEAEPDLDELVPLLGGNPLAIEMVAARVSFMPTSAILDLERTQTRPGEAFVARVKRSWEALPDNLRQPLLMLAQFRSPFGFDVADAAIGAGSLDVVDALSASGLLQARRQVPVRFLVPRWVAACVRELGSLDAGQAGRLLEASLLQPPWVDLARAIEVGCEQGLEPTDLHAAYRRLSFNGGEHVPSAVMHGLRAMLPTGEAYDEDMSDVSLCNQIIGSQEWAEGAELMSRVLERTVDPKATAWAHRQRGKASTHTRPFEDTAADFKEAARLFRELGEESLALGAEQNLCSMLLYYRSPQESLGPLRELRRQALAHGEKGTSRLALEDLAIAHGLLGQRAEAMQMAGLARELQEVQGTHLLRMAFVHSLVGDAEGAVALAEHGVALMEAASPVAGRVAQVHLASALAPAEPRRALAILEALGPGAIPIIEYGWSQLVRARCHALCGEWTEASLAQATGREFMGAVQVQDLPVFALGVRIAAHCGRSIDADLALVDEHRARFDVPFLGIEAELSTADAHRVRGEDDAAGEALERARALVDATSSADHPHVRWLFSSLGFA